jgi:hypothetical protein
MSNNKRRDIFSKIIAGSAPPPPKKKRKPNRPEHTEHSEHTEEISLSSIQETLDKISKQQSDLDTKVNEILDRVIRIEEDRIVDQEFINVLNLFN